LEKLLIVFVIICLLANISSTGRANYQKYANYCGFDVVGNPMLLERPLGAVRSSMWYWHEHGLNELADADNVLSITKRINGGTNGLQSRKNYLVLAKKSLGV